MSDCEKCKECGNETPNLTIKIIYNDNRVEKDCSNYVDNVTMLDGEEE